MAMNKPKITLTQKYLKEILYYDPDTGVFMWLAARSRINAGDIAGYVTIRSGKKYIDIGICGKTYRAHRLAWLYMHGAFPPNDIDHINGDGLNNSISNIKLSTAQENGMNKKLLSTNTSGMCGVSWGKGKNKWYSHIYYKGKQRYLGYYTTLLAATYARHVANIEYGFSVNHGKNRPL